MNTMSVVSGNILSRSGEFRGTNIVSSSTLHCGGEGYLLFLLSEDGRGVDSNCNKLEHLVFA
jgi:hypothetical protein